MQNFNSKFKSKFKSKFISENLEDTKKIAQEVVENFGKNDNLILLQGNLGAGKTTFSQVVLEYLKAEGPFTSPTFVVMKDYSVNFKNKKSTSFKKVFHLDCYRIEADDLIDLGWDEIIKDRNNLILLEWPEKIKKILPKKYIKIKFEILKENKRRIEIIKN